MKRILIVLLLLLITVGCKQKEQVKVEVIIESHYKSRELVNGRVVETAHLVVYFETTKDELYTVKLSSNELFMSVKYPIGSKLIVDQEALKPYTP